MKLKFIVAGLIFFLFSQIGPAARAQVGFSGLVLEVGGQAAGMGEAYAAVTSTPMALYWNPAGLGRIGQFEVGLAHNQWIQNIQSDFVAFGFPTRRAHFGFFTSLTNVGGIEYREGPSENPIATVGATSFIAGMGAARKLNDWLTVGASLKYIYYKLFLDWSWGIAADVGMQAQLPARGLFAAAALQNFGKMTKLYEEALQLPRQMRLGLAYWLPQQFLMGKWLFSSDYFVGFSSKNHLNFGLEYVLFEQLSLRMGYQTNYEIKDWHFGAGFRGHNWQIDYGFVPLNLGLAPAHRLSLNFYL